MVITSRFSSTARPMVPAMYCILISSTDCAALFRFNNRATLPDCLEDKAAATVLGTKFNSATA